MVTLSTEELRNERMRIGGVMAVAMRVLGCALQDGERDLATQTLYKIAELAEQLYAAENAAENPGEGEAITPPALHPPFPK